MPACTCLVQLMRNNRQPERTYTCTLPKHICLLVYTEAHIHACMHVHTVLRAGSRVYSYMNDEWWMMNDEWWMMNDEWWQLYEATRPVLSFQRIYAYIHTGWWPRLFNLHDGNRGLWGGLFGHHSVWPRISWKLLTGTGKHACMRHEYIQKKCAWIAGNVCGIQLHACTRTAIHTHTHTCTRACIIESQTTGQSPPKPTALHVVNIYLHACGRMHTRTHKHTYTQFTCTRTRAHTNQ